MGVGHLEKHELGIRQSVRLYDFLAENLAEPPLIIESDDIFEHAEEIVRKLCETLNVEYQPSMLEWPDDPKVTELFAKWSGMPNMIENTLPASTDGLNACSCSLCL